MSSQHETPDLGDAHTAWNHLEVLKWPQMVHKVRQGLGRGSGRSTAYVRSREIEARLNVD